MEIVVSAEPFIGESRISDELGREYAERFSEEAKAKVLIVQLASLGFRKFLCPYSPRLIRILHDIKREADLEVYPVVLDASKRSRELQAYGAAGMAKRQISMLTCGAVPRLALTLLKYFPGLARRDFKYFGLTLAALELAAFSSLRPKIVFLHEQMADLAIANKNLRFFELFSSLTRSYGSEPALITNNPVLVEQLGEQSVKAGYMVSNTHAGYDDMKRDERGDGSWNRTVVGKVKVMAAKADSSPMQSGRRKGGLLKQDTLLVEIADVKEGLKWKG